MSEKNDIEKNILRIAVVTLLFAINFQLLQYYKDIEINSLSFDFALKLMSNTFIGLALFIFLLYILSLGFENCYKSNNIKWTSPLLYDFGIFLTGIIIYMTFVIILGIKLSILFANYNILIYIFIISILIGIKLFGNFFQKHMDDFMIKLNILKIKKYFKKIDSQQECIKRNIKPEDINYVKTLIEKHNIHNSLIMIVFILLLSLLTYIFNIPFLAPFEQSIKNIQWMAFIFNFLAILFFIRGSFKNKYQIALETATLWGGNSFQKESLVKQKIDFTWGLYMLILSTTIYAIYLIFS